MPSHVLSFVHVHEFTFEHALTSFALPPPSFSILHTSATILLFLLSLDDKPFAVPTTGPRLALLLELANKNKKKIKTA